MRDSEMLKLVKRMDAINAAFANQMAVYNTDIIADFERVVLPELTRLVATYPNVQIPIPDTTKFVKSYLDSISIQDDLLGTSRILSLAIPKFEYVMADYGRIYQLADTSWVKGILPNITASDLTFGNMAAVHLLGDINQQIKLSQEISLPSLMLDFRFSDLISSLFEEVEIKQLADKTTESDELDTNDSEKLIIPTLSIGDITSKISQALSTPEEVLLKLTDDEFELLILERLHKMGWQAERHTKNVYEKDGGVDIIAWRPPNFTFIAVQVKHKRSQANRVGTKDVRDLLGVINGNELFSSGILVTNSTFTSDAWDWHKKHPYVLHLKDIHVLLNWLRDNFSDIFSYNHLPDVIELGGNISIDKTILTSFPLKQLKNGHDH